MLGTADDLVAADGVSVLSWQDVQRIAGGEDRQTVTRPGKLTVAQAAQDYFDTRTATTPHDRITWTKFISPTKLASMSVSEITTGDLERWLASQVPQTEDREKRRATQATANRRWSVLRAILNSASTLARSAMVLGLSRFTDWAELFEDKPTPDSWVRTDLDKLSWSYCELAR
jgi:hypothetical protein